MAWSGVGAILLALAVAFGAFGAHALRTRLDAYSIGVYERAVFYHFIHAMGVLVVSLLPKTGTFPVAGASLVAWLLTIEYRLQVRIVLKAILRCEPVLDFAGELGCLCFVVPGGRARHQIHDLAASLAGGQALLLFPEGANFTLPRWRTAIAELRSTGRIRAASRALRQSYTLPPHTGGVTAAVTGAPSANVLVLAHNGFCPDGRARLWWQLPMHRQLLVRTALFPAAELPQPDQLSPWLERTWTQVDAWVAGHTDPG